jgi:ankyrin repeat protein
MSESINKINDELSKACIFGDLEKIDFLLSNGANIHSKNIFRNSPIILTSFTGFIEIIKLLISNGANIYDEDGYGNSCISCASINGKVEIIKLLLSKGANINNKNKYNRTPIMEAYKNNKIEVIKILKRWPLTMLIIVLQELVVYNSLDFDSFIDFNEYFGTIV